MGVQKPMRPVDLVRQPPLAHQAEPPDLVGVVAGSLQELMQLERKEGEPDGRRDSIDDVDGWTC